MGQHDSRVMNMIDGKTRLAGSNKMELLLFGMGEKETYGINVFKVREVCEVRAITATPNMPPSVEGIISLRGSIIPVINLAVCAGMPRHTGGGKLIITEFSSSTQAFLVKEVDRIVRVDWEQVRAPQAALAAGGHGLVTAITELPEGKLVSILDVEQILSDVMGEVNPGTLEAVPTENVLPIFFADDSALARKKITQVLDQMGLPHQEAHNGQDAWDRLQVLADQAEQDNVPLRRRLGLVLVDAEMPEMDGYVLTRHIKADRRFEGIPVMMHSSLSSIANRKLGQQVGVDAYVAKFHFDELAAAITGMLRNRKEAA